MTQEDIYKVTPISNIMQMQKVIGTTVSSFKSLMKKSYDDLHEEQCSLIEHYNEVVKNRKLQEDENN